MAQPPTKADILQIEPGAAGTRTIDRDPTAGDLRFISPVFPLGVTLAQLVGLQSLSNLFLVGSGSGQYATIQDALDAVSDLSSITNPSFIFVSTGIYTENIEINKDGVILATLGYVKLTNDTSDATVRVIQRTTGVVPRFVRMLGFTIENTAAGESCVDIDGSNTFASGTVTVNTAPLAVGDTVTIAGFPLTGVSGARTPGSDNFNSALLTVNALAAEIAAAINDTANSFVGTVTATALGAVVTVVAVAPGVGGNAITLAVSTTPPGNLTRSGATLAGGGGLDSEVGLNEIGLFGCDILAGAVGTRQITATTMNTVRVEGGSWFGSTSTSESIVSQVASFHLHGVGWVNDIQAAYDTGDAQPSVTTSEFQVVGCTRVNDLLINFIGAGSTLVANCPTVGDVTHNGDRSFTAINCEFGDMLVEDTVAARFVNCTRGTIGGTGTPTVAESSLVLTSGLVAAGSDVVVFDRPQPNAVYAVHVDAPTAGAVANVTTKTATGFTVTYSIPVTGTAFYSILRQM